MLLLIGALTIGLILALLAFGVFISFRIFEFPDITTEGSITLGGSVAAVLIVAHVNPFAATLAAFAAGALAGTATAVLHTQFKIHSLLSGILVMTALYSVNLHIMGKSNVPLLTEVTLATHAEQVGVSMFGGATNFNIFGWEVSTRDGAVFFFSFTFIAVVGTILYAFFRTNLGTAMRAAGDNAQMITALGANV